MSVFGRIPHKCFFLGVLLVWIQCVAPAAAQDPTIITQPVSLTNKAGTYPSFSVVASGTAPLGAQWFKNGLAVGAGSWTGQTNVFTIVYARKPNEGEYFVVVTNLVGSVTSSIVNLTVHDPAIGAQPSHPNIQSPGSATLSVGALGTAPFRYQWRFAGNPIASATNSSLTVFGAATNAGVYDAIVYNIYGTATSALGIVTVNMSAIDDWMADANAVVYATALQLDGRLVIGGSFTTIDNSARNRIARIFANGDIDPAFNPNANGDVYCILPMPDGKLLVGGSFTSIGGRNRSFLARLHPDGTQDTNFTAVATGTIYCLARQPDGYILAGGVNKLLRFNQDGTVDATFNPVVSGTIYSIVAQETIASAESGIVVGGSFFSIAGGARQNLARLRYNGQLDSHFNSPVLGTVYAMTSVQGGGVVLGGQFTKVGQTPRANLARVDLLGSLDGSFDPGASNVVFSLTRQTDGKILVGGAFTSLAGVPRYYLGRLHSNGSIDPLFNPGANQVVYSLALQADGCLVAGGLFSNFANAARKYVARLDATNDVAQSLTAAGGSITWLRGGGLPYLDGAMFERYVQGAGWVPIGEGERITGGWQVAGTVPPGATLRAWGRTSCGRGGGSGSIIQYASGPVVVLTQPVSVNTPSAAYVTMSAEVGGTEPFTYQWYRNGIPVAGATNAVYEYGTIGSWQVAVCNAFGCVQSDVAMVWRLNAVESSSRANPSSAVHAIAVAGDGKILLGGGFTNVSNAQRRGVVRLHTNNELDADFDPDVDGTVFCMAVQPDQRILLGGNFTRVGGVARSGLARINSDGTLDASFVANISGFPGEAVHCLSLESNGDILVGGNFMSIGGQARKCLARLEGNGSVDAGFVPAANLHPLPQVNSILQMPNALIMLGGCFAVNPNSYQTYQWVQPNGGFAAGGYPALSPSSTVFAMLRQPDDKVLLGGFGIRTDSNSPDRPIVRLNNDYSADTGFAALANGPVYCLTAQANGRVLVGGAFTTLNGAGRNGLGRLNADGSLDTDFNPTFMGTGPAAIYTVAVQTDGKISAGGSFTNASRQHYARLPLTESVSEEWSYAGSTLTWRRDGPPPEIDSVLLEFSPDGASWQALAEGTRVEDTWHFEGVVFPFPQMVRARGRVLPSGINFWQTDTRLLAPAISIEPASRTNGLGSIASFYVAAQGQGPLSYQWFRNGIALQDGGSVAGAKGALLTFRVDDLPGAVYQVTVSNLFGVVTSSAAELISFDPARPPVILSNEGGFGLHTNHFAFRFQGVPGQICVIERSDSMKWWTSVTNITLRSFDPVVFADPMAQVVQRYYRVRLSR